MINKNSRKLSLKIFSLTALLAIGVLPSSVRGENEDRLKRWSGFSHPNTDLIVEDLSDNDEDGVVAARDACPKSVIGAAVDDKGCAIELSNIDSYNLNIQFATNEIKITDKYAEDIAKLAKRFVSSGAKLLLVEGHTDNIGGKKYNIKLSKQRALAVADILVDKYAVKIEQLLISGQGAQFPIASNETASGRAKNRRMVAYFTFDDRMTQLDWNVWSVNVHNGEDDVDYRKFQVVDKDDLK